MNRIVDNLGRQLIDLRNSLYNYLGNVYNGSTTLNINDVSNRLNINSKINILNEVKKDELYIECNKCIAITCTEYITDKEFNRLHDKIKFSEMREPQFISVVREAVGKAIEKWLGNLELQVKIDSVGKSFEMLLSDITSNGSDLSYSPQDIVEYMNKKCVENYFEKFDIDLSKIKSLTVLDPSVGAGAYVVNMIERLYKLRVELGEQESIQDTYRDIIRNNIYAIDMEEVAVCFTVCRLYMLVGDVVEHNIRCGSALMESVELDGQVVLPIIDTVENAPSHTVWNIFDKLVNSAKSKGDIDSMIEYSIDMQGLFDNCVDDDEVDEMLDRYLNEMKNKFIWQRDFKKAYLDGGFDIIVGNPPYVRCEKIKEPRAYIEKHYDKVFNGSAEIFVYFYNRGYQLLKENGILGYITSNKWFKAKYAEKLRNFFKDETSVIKIVDFKDNRVFSAGVNTEITFIRKAEPQEDVIYIDASTYSKEIQEEIREVRDEDFDGYF